MQEKRSKIQSSNSSSEGQENPTNNKERRKAETHKFNFFANNSNNQYIIKLGWNILNLLSHL
ncbi:hypothetical protein ACE6H2_019010 [Prunus campanulata]